MLALTVIGTNYSHEYLNGASEDSFSQCRLRSSKRLPNGG